MPFSPRSVPRVKKTRLEPGALLDIDVSIPGLFQERSEWNASAVKLLNINVPLFMVDSFTLQRLTFCVRDLSWKWLVLYQRYPHNAFPSRWPARFTHDTIALAVFGVDVDSTSATDDRPCRSFQAIESSLSIVNALLYDATKMWDILNIFNRWCLIAEY